MEDEYKTADMGLATTLQYLGYFIVRMENDKEKISKKFFVFENSEQLQKHIDDYWRNNITVEPIKFFSILKEIKNRIYS